MGFYNPYQKGPDMAQGIQGIIQQIMQMQMMKKLMGSGGQSTASAGLPAAQTPLPGTGIQGMQTPVASATSASPTGNAYQPLASGTNPLSNIDPQLLMRIMQLLKQLPGGLGGGVGGGVGGGLGLGQ